jgi:tyrosinase
MPKFSRRAFLGSLAGIPFALSLRKNAYASAPAFVRYDVMSAQGQDMLKTYAGAVKTMMGTPDGNPVGWLFQWYTHSVRSDTTKVKEIARIYTAPSPQKDLALAAWDTCQAHGLPEQFQKFFLPWHRMYVFYLERIIRKVSGRADFTLPYWNYSNSGAQSGPQLPPQFRMKGDQTYGSLYVEKRNPVQPAWPGGAKVNAGDPIDKFDSGALDLTALNECDFLPVDDGPQGFSAAIDGVLHGNVHVLVGNMRNMGDVPWAAYDPVFWLHHCNIDRLWESWNRAGGRNPTSDAGWMGTKFIFADENGSRVERAVQEFLDIASLGYLYDRLEVPPSRTCPPPPGNALVAPRIAQRRASVITGSIQLQPTPVRVTLEPPPPSRGSLQEPLGSRVAALGPTRQLYLVAKGVHAESQPGVLYHLYLDPPPGRRLTPGRGNPYYVGTINFFDAGAHAGRHEGHSGSGEVTKSFSLNVTRVARNLQARRRLSPKPGLMIAPVGQPAEEAKPVIGEISLVEY